MSIGALAPALTRLVPTRWRRLPREARDTLFLLAVIGWTVLPHTSHLPFWCSALTATMLLWRGALAFRSAPLPSRWVLFAILVIALALTAWTHRTLAGKEAGVTLLVVLVALKTLELRARRDAFAVFFLGFFLVLTHFLYSQSLAIAAATVVSVWGLLTALVLAHMPVGQPSLHQAARLAGRFALLGAPVMAILFMLFPRVGPLWGLPRDAGATTGLSGEMRMGSIAELAADESIALRVRFLSGRPPPPEALYFRGPVLGRFDGNAWRVLQPRFSAHPANDSELRPLGEPVAYEMTLEPLRLSMIPVLEATPVLPPLDDLRTVQRADLHWVTHRPVTERLRFTAQAWLRFEHGPQEPDFGLREHLELPAGYNPRLVAWAASLPGSQTGASDGERLAALLYQRIREQDYGYTLTPGSYDDDGSGDAIDEFWFDRKLGFCEHFAAAFVVAMRAAGVPARIVTGYQGAERDEQGTSLIVRQSYAHAWAEYWQAGKGWVRADPTAQVAPDRISRSRALLAPPGLMAGAIDGLAPGLLTKARALWEGIDNRYKQWVLNYSRGSQLDLMKNLGFSSPSWQDLGLVLIGVITGASLLGAVWAWWDQRRIDPWLRAYARVRRAAAAHGVEAGDALPPRGLAEALGRHFGAGAAGPALRALQALDALRYARPDGANLSSRAARADARRLAGEAVQALQALPRTRDAARPADPLAAPAAYGKPTAAIAPTSGPSRTEPIAPPSR